MLEVLHDNRWWIQDLPEKGWQLQWGCANLLFGKFLPKNCMKLKEIGLRGREELHFGDSSTMQISHFAYPRRVSQFLYPRKVKSFCIPNLTPTEHKIIKIVSQFCAIVCCSTKLVNYAEPIQFRVRFDIYLLFGLVTPLSKLLHKKATMKRKYEVHANYDTSQNLPVTLTLILSLTISPHLFTKSCS